MKARSMKEAFKKEGPEEEGEATVDTTYNAIDAPIKFQLPIVTGAPEWSPGTSFKLRFKIDSDVPIRDLEMLVEFDNDKLVPPSCNIEREELENQFDFPSNSMFNFVDIKCPGDVYRGEVLYSNQILVIMSAPSEIPAGTDIPVVDMPFMISAGTTSSANVYVAGSAGSLLNGFKDIAILYRLAARHAEAAAARVRRLYNKEDEANREMCFNFINEEVERIGFWFEHIQSLLADCATDAEIANLDQLQTSINQVASSLSSLDAMREFIASGANIFGFPDEYLPFFNLETEDSFDAIYKIVERAFVAAGSAETNAVRTYAKLLDTKDRIRNELFTINEQAENRLVQVCGRVDADGNPSLNVNDSIDYDLKASFKNLACEIGQNTLLYERALANLEKANADIRQYIEDIELEKRYLQNAVALKNQIPGIIDEYGRMQAKLDKELAKVNAKFDSMLFLEQLRR